MRADPSPLANAVKCPAELRIVIQHHNVWHAGPIAKADIQEDLRRFRRRRGVSLGQTDNFAAKMVHVDLHQIETHRRRLKGADEVDALHPPAPRRERKSVEQAPRPGMVRFHALADRTAGHVVRHRLSHAGPEHQAPGQREGRVPPEVARQGRVVQVSHDLCSEPSPLRDAQPRRAALPLAVKQTTPDDEGAPAGNVGPATAVLLGALYCPPVAVHRLPRRGGGALEYRAK